MGRCDQILDPPQILGGGEVQILGNCLKNVKIIGFLTFSETF